MKYFLLKLISLLLLLNILTGCNQLLANIEATSGGRTEEAQEAQVRAASAAWDDAFNAADLERLVALYAEDAVDMPPGFPALEGIEAISGDLQYIFETFDARHQTSIVDLKIDGDLALDETPYDTWAEFVAWARENPGATYMYLGAESKLIMETIAEIEGLELEYIAASGGAAVIPALQGYEVDIAFSGGIHGRYLDVEEGKMKVLMSTLPAGQALQATPDVPNMYDLGYDGETAFQGILVAPAGLTDDVFQTLTNVAEVAANHPDYAAVMNKLQFPITFLKGEAAHTVITEQRAAFEATQ